MREIKNPSGETYARVKVEDGKLMIQLAKGNYNNLWIHMDAKIIPQLRQILAEAEFLKYI